MTGNTDDGPGERGQVIIVMGLVLAVSLVGLALILNSVIYAENLATREGASVEGVLVTNEVVEAAVEGSIVRVNRRHAESETAVTENLTDAVAAWNGLAARHAATDGAAVHASLVSVTDGTRIQQTDASRNFTAGNASASAADWTLVSNTPAVRSFALTVNRDGLHEGSLDDASTLTDHGFRVEVTEAGGTETWTVYVVRNTSTGVVVFEEDPGESVSGALTEYCAVDEQQVTVSLTAGTVGGQPCPHLSAPSFGGDLTVEFHNADNATGTYSLVVNETSIDQTPYEDASSGDSPYSTPAVYSVRLSLRYDDGETVFERESRVFPGEEIT